MSFDVAATAYQRFMGRYADPLADRFCVFAGVAPGDRALDVGCGPGALTERLAGILGPSQVSAIDPSVPFVEATRHRCPGVEVRAGRAEQLPYADGRFDITLAQLVVHFMRDPVAGLAEMARVTRPGGTVAACVWDHAGGTGPVSPFLSAVREFDPGAVTEAGLAGSAEGQLEDLCRRSALTDIVGGRLTVEVGYASFEEWWEPYTDGVGPAGDYVGGLSEENRARLGRLCARRLPEPPFRISASAWAIRASAS